MRNSRLGPALLLWLVVSASPALAAEDASAPKPPITLTLNYTLDSLTNFTGGLNRADRFLDKLALAAAYDGTEVGREGLTGLISLQRVGNSSFSSKVVGDAQVVDNIEAVGATRIYEAWISQEFVHGLVSVKAGVVDLNSDFDTNETGAVFLNSSHGIGPDFARSGIDGPSIYPIPALALTGLLRPAEGWIARLGVFDGVAGDPEHQTSFFSAKFSERYGALVVGQLERRFGEKGRVEGGVWSFTGTYDEVDQSGLPAGQTRHGQGAAGAYGIVEDKLLAKPGEDEGGLNGWLRVGLDNGDFNRISNYEGAGLVYTGLVPGRDKDQAGVAIARAGFGGAARTQSQAIGVKLRDAETTFEATYRFAVHDVLTVQPDLQYVVNPSGDPHLGNAFVAGVRFVVTATR